MMESHEHRTFLAQVMTHRSIGLGSADPQRQPVLSAGLTGLGMTENFSRMRDQICQILAEHGRLPVDVASLRDDTDLYELGLSSHASVNLMLALENHFDVEFPERMLRRRTFESVAAIQAAIEELTGVREPSV